MRRYLAYRLPLVFVLVLAATLVWTLRRPAVQLSEAALAQTGVEGWRRRAAEFLSRANGLAVRPADVRFLPSDARPRWYAGLVDVPVVFTAVPTQPPIQVPVATRLADLWYVELAVSEDGVPIDQGRLTNLTRSPHADESVGVQLGALVALAVRGESGQLSAVQLYDFGAGSEVLGGLRGAPRWLNELVCGLENRQSTGRWEGVWRSDYRLTVPVGWSELAVTDEGALRLTARAHRPGHPPATVEARWSAEPPYALVAGGDWVVAAPSPRPVVDGLADWLANWLRNMRPIGPDKIAAAESLAFGLAGVIGPGLGGSAEPPRLGTSAVEWLGLAGDPAPGLAEAPTWAPPPVEPSGAGPRAAGEGEWRALEPAWLRPGWRGPPAFAATWLRPDPERDWSIVIALAIDLRQVELGYEQGRLHPHPTTGLFGTGRLPDDAGQPDRLLAVFNGGFKTVHGAYGSVVDGVVYVPPVEGAATVAWVDPGADGGPSLRYGTWGATASPEPVVSLRQNLPPLVADGRFDPQGRGEWGLRPPTVRSGLCFRGESTAVYFWSRWATAEAMGRAMLTVGCEYGLHLDMNADLAGFAFQRVASPGEGAVRSAAIAASMSFREPRWLRGDSRDFFYLLRRTSFLDRLPRVAGVHWSDEEIPRGADGLFAVAARAADDVVGVRLLALDRRRLAAGGGLADAAAGESTGGGAQVGGAGARGGNAVRLALSLPFAGDGEPVATGSAWLWIDDARRLSVGPAPAGDATERWAVPLPALGEARTAWPPETVCGSVGRLDVEGEPDGALLFAWGTLADLGAFFARLGRHPTAPVAVLGCGSEMARVERLDAEASGGWLATDLSTGDSRALPAAGDGTPRVVLRPLALPPAQRRFGVDGRAHEGGVER